MRSGRERIVRAKRTFEHNLIAHPDSRAHRFAIAMFSLVATLIALAATPIAPARVLAASAEPYFLVATHDLMDPIFGESVILILPVTEGGLLMGVIINKPTRVRVQDLITGAPVLAKPADSAFLGGPVEVNTPSILMRATRSPADSIHVFEDVYLVTDPALISSYVKAPPEVNGVRVIVGRAQWMPDQLQAEIAGGSWYKAPAEVDTIFSSDPAKVWQTLVQRGQLQEADAGDDPAPAVAVRGTFLGMR